ncbi:HAD hydrolase family protein [Flexivirga oryzae]|uniref:Hydroxymethylpyrimidine pyrophosphatase-like HAD family hydrolase n=1 Tax=Flexivirga oryzae TaxID=1794944 RepID=A0A839N5R6_9MICO|nr:HAD hydrolase family protein [Flexivirga oryzae]MBB2893088.1 hydroxymethylpyrimidine pyrophosphatase-like HAD family hydrolase [Flexivirga oryzae]
MGRRYADELGELSETYQAVRALEDEDLAKLSRVQSEFNRHSAYFVGSGGALAMAQLAARVHGAHSSYPSSAVTPLTLALGDGLRPTNATVGLFSARARHPDVRLAARAVRAGPGNRVVLLTQLSASKVAPELAAVVDEIVTLPRTAKDGFLATNSILAMGSAWLRAAGFDLPDRLPMLDAPMSPWPEEVRRALVLYGPDQLAAAYDVEARLSETGLVDVQLADLRNMAHGRHVGLLNRAASTVVVTLGDPGSQPLVNKTIGVLPSSLRAVDLSTRISGPVGTLDSLVGCMRLAGEIGAVSGVDPGQPPVSTTGRKLYHLPWASLASSPDGSRPARVKAIAAGMVDRNRADLDAWMDAWQTWRTSVCGRPLAAVVLDYDGTCVPTARRTKPPTQEVQDEIHRLLEHGVRIAFASGRGPSVIDELRRWIRQPLWNEVVIGIYNGAVINPLAEDVERGTVADGDLATAADILSRRLVGEGWDLSARRWQVTVQRGGAALADTGAAVAAILEPALGERLKVVESGHSVDIVSRSTSKRAVVDHLGVDSSNVLLIGDQGEVGGNDFELLSYSDLSLSVDRVSADGSRCWNLSEDGTAGPALLTRYLRAVQLRERAGARFSWKQPGMRRSS